MKLLKIFMIKNVDLLAFDISIFINKIYIKIIYIFYYMNILNYKYQ